MFPEPKPATSFDFNNILYHKDGPCAITPQESIVERSSAEHATKLASP